MKTLRFKVGDLARFVSSVDPACVGKICEIVGVNVHSSHGNPYDYAITFPCGTITPHPITGNRWCTMDFRLAPLPGDSRIHADTLKLFDQKPNTDLPVGPKVKERV